VAGARELLKNLPLFIFNGDPVPLRKIKQGSCALVLFFLRKKDFFYVRGAALKDFYDRIDTVNDLRHVLPRYKKGV
jgi:hypothetical protein